MRLSRFADPLAHGLLRLRTVSGTQWLLRTVAVLATVLALLLALRGELFGHAGSAVVTLLVLAVAALQAARPDTDLALLAPLAILVSLVGQGDLGIVRALGVGLALLLAHSAAALAATLPVHGRFEPSAWALAGRGLLGVLVVTLAGAFVVLGLSGVRLGAWALVLGVVAVLGLLIVALPRTGR